MRGMLSYLGSHHNLKMRNLIPVKDLLLLGERSTAIIMRLVLILILAVWMFLQNTGIFLQAHAALQPGGPTSTPSLP
jgi:hypothetical protein